MPVNWPEIDRMWSRYAWFPMLWAYGLKHFLYIQIFENFKIQLFRNKIWTFYFQVEHKKTTEEIVRVKKEKDAVTATLAKRNDQLIDAVKRARDAIKILQPVAVSFL